MEINRRKRRFYPEFYTDEEIEELERQNVQDDINDANRAAADYNGEDVPVLYPLSDISDTPNIPNISDAPRMSDSPKKEAGENIKRAAEVKNYNDLLYPSSIKLSSAYKQLDNMQNDYIEKKLNMTKEPTRNIAPVGYDDDGRYAENPIKKEKEKEYFPEIPPDIKEIPIEIPDDMYCDYMPAVQTIGDSVQYEDDYNLTEVPEVPEISENIQQSSLPFSLPANDRDISDNDESIADNEPLEYEEAEKSEEPAEVTYKDEGEENEYSEAVSDNSENKLNPDIPVMSYIQDNPEEPEEPKIPEEAEQPAESQIPVNPKLIPFDKESAVKYALCWALDRNPNFLNFDDLGGDCTNYISQILLAGGCKMDMTPVLGWYYVNGNDKSPSWTGVEQFYKYVTGDKDFGIAAKEIRLDEAEAGDIVQLSFNGKTFQHTPFITEVNRDADDMYEQIKVCAHSFDSKNRSLNTYQWRKIRFIRILGYIEK